MPRRNRGSFAVEVPKRNKPAFSTVFDIDNVPNVISILAPSTGVSLPQ
jgi:hypothetical protein